MLNKIPNILKLASKFPKEARGEICAEFERQARFMLEFCQKYNVLKADADVILGTTMDVGRHFAFKKKRKANPYNIYKNEISKRKKVDGKR